MGFFYFTKTAEAKFQSLYIIADQKDKSKLDGVVGFIDFDNKTYTVATYQDNKLTGLYEMKDTRSFFAGAFATGNSGAIRQKINDACPEVTSIVRLADGRDSVVIKTNGTGIGCPSAGGETGGFWAAIWKGITDFLNGIGTFFDTLFGGSSSGYTGGFTGGGAFGSGGYSGWGFGGFVSGGYGVGYSGGGGGYSDPGTGGTGPYDPYRGAWEPYDPGTLGTAMTDESMSDDDIVRDILNAAFIDPSLQKPRPSFTDMKNNSLPSSDWSVVAVKIGGEVQKELQYGSNNTCATRVSYALNYSNSPIPSKSYAFLGADNKNYIMGAQTMLSYLIQSYGTSASNTIHLKNSGSQPLTESYIEGQLRGKQGIYAIIPNDPSKRTGFGASGHVDLLSSDGSFASGHTYYGARGGVKEVYLFILN